LIKNKQGLVKEISIILRTYQTIKEQKMKNFIKITILALGIAVLAMICWDRAWDSKCDYWEGLDNPTKTMVELCPDHF